MAELDGAGLAARDARARATSRRPSGAPTPTRRCTSRPTPPTPPAARCCSGCRSRPRPSRPGWCSGSSSGPRSTTTRAEELLAHDGLDFARHHLRVGPPLPPAPAHRARGEADEREGGHGLERLGAPVRGADLGDRGRSSPTRTSRSRSRSRCRKLSSPDRERAPRGRRGRHRRRCSPACAPAATSSTRCSPTRRIDDRLRGYRHWLQARNLANEASDESVQALVDGRARRATRSPRRWYRLKAQLLGLDRLKDYDRMAAVAEDEDEIPWDEARDARARLLRRLLRASSATLVGRFFDENWIDAPVRPGKRGGRVLRLHGALRAPVRAAQLHGQAPRRAHARARARPRRARRARRLAGRLPHGHAADARRDRVGVRRDDRLRPPARAGRDAASRASTCWPRSIEGSIATVFRQIAMNRFEHLVHTARREEGELSRRALRRAVGGVADGDARRRRRGHRGLPHLVVLRPALHRHAGLRLRLRLRPAARAVGLRALRGGGRGLRPRLPRAAARRRLAAAGGARAASSASTSPTRASGTRGLDLVERQLDAAEDAAAATGRT